MNYNVGMSTKKKAAGKDIIVCNLKDGDGNIIKDVTIWALDKDNKPFPGFNEISTGSVIEGNLWQKPGTENWTLYPNKPKTNGVSGMGKALMAEKAKTIEHAQDRKTQSIAHAQERNEVMYAKKSAAELIAHHPAYKDLNDLNLTAIFMNLTRTILNFNPNTSLTGLEIDDMDEHKLSYNQAMDKDDGFDQISAENIPF